MLDRLQERLYTISLQMLHVSFCGFVRIVGHGHVFQGKGGGVVFFWVK